MKIFSNMSALLFAALFFGLPLTYSVDAAAKVRATVPEGSQEQRVGRILDAAGSNVQTSAIAIKLSDGSTIFERNPDDLLSPASVTKILTSAVGLYRFGPARTFKTKVYYSGVRSGSRISGDLIIVGDGDPFLVSEKLWQFAADVRNMGITEISGDIVIDNSLFDDETRDQSRSSGIKQSVNAYDAPVSAVGVNFNTLAVAVGPGSKVGEAARVGIDPYPLKDVSFDNKATTTNGSGSTIQVKRVGDESKNPRLEITGNIGINAPLKKVYRSVGDFVGSAGEYVRSFLVADGIKVTGRVREGRKPEGASQLIEIESYDLRKIASGLNVFSNNYIADMLLKRLGAEFSSSSTNGAPGSGSFKNGLGVLRSFLTDNVGIKTPMVIENGSGLDTRNRLSARQVAAVLGFMETKMVVFPDFIASLPAYGWDGTLKKRAKGNLTNIHGMVRAKSGTLSEPITVVSLAGYFRHKKHGLVAFAVIQNGKKGAPQPGVADLREHQDDFVAAFLD